MKSIYDIAFQAAEDIRNRVRKDITDAAIWVINDDLHSPFKDRNDVRAGIYFAHSMTAIDSTAMYALLDFLKGLPEDAFDNDRSSIPCLNPFTEEGQRAWKKIMSDYSDKSLNLS